MAFEVDWVEKDDALLSSNQFIDTWFHPLCLFSCHGSVLCCRIFGLNHLRIPADMAHDFLRQHSSVHTPPGSPPGNLDLAVSSIRTIPPKLCVLRTDRELRFRSGNSPKSPLKQFFKMLIPYSDMCVVRWDPTHWLATLYRQKKASQTLKSLSEPNGHRVLP